MSFSAAMQISDQDVYQQTTASGGELIGQLGQTSDSRMFRYAKAGGTLVAGRITEGLAITANYANRALTTSAAANQNQVTIVLGTTATQDQFLGQWLVVNDNTGQGQGAYYITGNTAATAGNSNTTVVSIKGFLNVAISSTATATDVTIIPNLYSSVIEHTAVITLVTAGAPIIAVTSGNYHWQQVGGMASILSDGTITKNAQGIPSDATAGAVEIRVDATIIQPVGYAPEATTTTDYTPFVLTLY